MTAREAELEETLENILKCVIDLNLVDLDPCCPKEEALFHILCFANNAIKSKFIYEDKK